MASRLRTLEQMSLSLNFTDRLRSKSALTTSAQHNGDQIGLELVSSPESSAQSSINMNSARSSAPRSGTSTPTLNGKRIRQPSMELKTGANYDQKRKLRKNTREKQRRTEINDQFDALSEILCLHSGSKVEKYTVLQNAIATITSLRQEVVDFRAEKVELRTELEKFNHVLLSNSTDGSGGTQITDAFNKIMKRFFPHSSGGSDEYSAKSVSESDKTRAKAVNGHRVGLPEINSSFDVQNNSVAALPSYPSNSLQTTESCSLSKSAAIDLKLSLHNPILDSISRDSHLRQLSFSMQSLSIPEHGTPLKQSLPLFSSTPCSTTPSHIPSMLSEILPTESLSNAMGNRHRGINFGGSVHKRAPSAGLASVTFSPQIVASAAEQLSAYSSPIDGAAEHFLYNMPSHRRNSSFGSFGSGTFNFALHNPHTALHVQSPLMLHDQNIDDHRSQPERPLSCGNDVLNEPNCLDVDMIHGSSLPDVHSIPTHSRTPSFGPAGHHILGASTTQYLSEPEAG